MSTLVDGVLNNTMWEGAQKKHSRFDDVATSLDKTHNMWGEPMKCLTFWGLGNGSSNGCVDVWTHTVNKWLGVFSKYDIFQLGLSAWILYNNLNSGCHSFKKSDHARPHIYTSSRTDMLVGVWTTPSQDWQSKPSMATNRTSRSCKVTVK